MWQSTNNLQISTVNFLVDSRTALDDSFTTIKQGNNIKVLTLITILFLPLSYITVSFNPPTFHMNSLTPKQGLFSENHGVLPENAGRDLYAGLVVVLTLFTYGLAFFLQWDKLDSHLNGTKRRPNPAVQKHRLQSNAEEVVLQKNKRSSSDSRYNLNGSAGKPGWGLSWRKGTRPKHEV